MIVNYQIEKKIYVGKQTNIRPTAEKKEISIRDLLISLGMNLVEFDVFVNGLVKPGFYPITGKEDIIIRERFKCAKCGI